MARVLDAGRTLVVFLLATAITYGLLVLLGAWSPQLGLGLQGGTRITLLARDSPAEAVTPQRLNATRTLIDRRLRAAAVTDAQVTTSGTHQIVVEMPGTSPRDVVGTLTRPGNLELRVVAAIANDATGESELTPRERAGTGRRTPSRPATPTGDTLLGDGLSRTERALAWVNSPDARWMSRLERFTCPQADLSGATTSASTSATSPDHPLMLCDDNGRRMLLSPAVSTPSALRSAQPLTPSPESQDWGVGVRFDTSGTAEVEQLSRALVGTDRRYAAVLDGAIVATPGMPQPITDGLVRLVGDFSESRARSIATSLDHGPLPVTFAQGVTVETVGPALAGEQLRVGFTAAGMGVGLVVLFILLHYRRWGVVMIASLGVTSLLTYAALALLSSGAGFTLTLPGIAALMVGAGVAADSFIILVERIRDEVRTGEASSSQLFEGSWAQTRRVCVVADLAVLLSAVILHVFSAGVVKGFALALGVVTMLDLVVLIGFTRPFVTLLLQRGLLTFDQLEPTPQRPREQLAPRVRIGRRAWAGLSVLVLLASLSGLLIRDLEPGVDFTGGSEFHVRTSGQPEPQELADRLRQALDDGSLSGLGDKVDKKGSGGLQGLTAATAGDDGILIRTGPLGEAESRRLVDLLRAAAGPSAIDISQTQVGPRWGRQVIDRALSAGLLSWLVVALFLAAGYRRPRVAVAASLTAGFGLLVTVGVYAWLGLDVSPAALTGFLTVLAFSFYNTVVALSEEPTSARTRITAVVALIPLGALLYASVVHLGPGPLRDVAVALTTGTAVSLWSAQIIARPLARLPHIDRAQSSA